MEIFPIVHGYPPPPEYLPNALEGHPVSTIIKVVLVEPRTRKFGVTASMTSGIVICLSARWFLQKTRRGFGGIDSGGIWTCTINDCLFQTLSLWNCLSNLALTVPIFSNMVATKDGEPIAHMHAINLPHDLIRQGLLHCEILNALL